MLKFKLLFFYFIIPLCVFSQTDTLRTISEFDTPCPCPWGLASDKKNLWVGDDSLANIYEIMLNGEILNTIHITDCIIKGITFLDDTLWIVNGRSVGDTLLFNSWDSTFYSYFFYCIYKIDKFSGAKLDSIRMISCPTIMLGIAYYNSKFYVSYNGGWGDCMFEIDPKAKKVIQTLCCAHPCGLTTIYDTLWCVRMNSQHRTGNLIVPLEIQGDLSKELRELGYRIDFYATDITFDGINIWLCDPDAKKIKKMAKIRTTVPPKNYTNIPSFYKLYQSYPNPFNDKTSIWYQLVESVHVTIRVYNLKGQYLRKLVDINQTAGSYIVYWDGKDQFGFDMPTGVYLYKMIANDFISVKKMILIR